MGTAILLGCTAAALALLVAMAFCVVVADDEACGTLCSECGQLKHNMLRGLDGTPTCTDCLAERRNTWK